jgi:hypothetical protein
VQTTSRDILSIPERSKRASKAAGGISYGSAVRSGAARAEFTGIVMDADNLVEHGERDLVHHGERDLVQHGERELVQHSERDLGRSPRMESSAVHIQQRQYDRIFEYEYQNHGTQFVSRMITPMHRRFIIPISE